jgi:hypothetical protein
VQTESGGGPHKVGEERVRVGPDNGEPLGGDGFRIGGARFGVGGAGCGEHGAGFGVVGAGFGDNQGRDGYADQVNVQGVQGNRGTQEWPQEADTPPQNLASVPDSSNKKAKGQGCAQNANIGAK